MKIVKIKRPDLGGGWSAIDPHGKEGQRCLLDEIDTTEIGDHLILEVVEMDEQEFEALPEFEGW